MNIEELADELVRRMGELAVGTAITVLPSGQLLVEEPGAPPLSGTDRRDELAVFVRTHALPARSAILSRLRAGRSRLNLE